MDSLYVLHRIPCYIAEHLNCISITEIIIFTCFSDPNSKVIVQFGVILVSCIVTCTSAFLLHAVNYLAFVDCLRRGVGSLRLQPCSEVTVWLTSCMLLHLLLSLERSLRTRWISLIKPSLGHISDLKILSNLRHLGKMT